MGPKQLLGIGIFIFGIAGIVVLVWLLISKPKSYVRVDTKDKWQVNLQSKDGWFYTGIPIVANERITIKTSDDLDDPIMVRLEDQIVYVQMRKRGVTIDAVEWDSKGGFSNVPPDYRGNLVLKVGNRDDFWISMTIESSLGNCINLDHLQVHGDAADWWNQQCVKLTEK
jgi:hypothetical protein